MFPSATAAKWHQTRLKQPESLEKKVTIWEWLEADLPIGVIHESLSMQMKTANAGISHPSAHGMG